MSVYGTELAKPALRPKGSFRIRQADIGQPSPVRRATGGRGKASVASAFARRSRRDMLNLSLSAHDPLRTSMDPSGCVVRSIQPTLPGSGVISQSNWIPRCSSLCPHRLGLCYGSRRGIRAGRAGVAGHRGLTRSGRAIFFRRVPGTGGPDEHLRSTARIHRCGRKRDDVAGHRARQFSEWTQ